MDASCPLSQSSLTSLASVDSKALATAWNSPSTTIASQSTVMRSPRSPPPPLRSPTSAHQSLPSPQSTHVSPLTPPPTPPSLFDARTAAAQCRAMNGYVSFANVQGLGVPDGAEDDVDEGEEEKGRGRWWGFLQIASKRRSDSTSSIHSAA